MMGHSTNTDADAVRSSLKRTAGIFLGTTNDLAHTTLQ